jgi:hypothetical protein
VGNVLWVHGGVEVGLCAKLEQQENDNQRHVGFLLEFYGLRKKVREIHEIVSKIGEGPNAQKK